MAIMQATITEGFRLSPHQEHLWLVQQVGNSLPYRVQCAVSIEGNISPKILKSVLKKIVNKYEIFRTTFHYLPGMRLPVQVISDSSIKWEDYDLSDLSAEEQEAKIEALFNELKQLPIDFEKGPILHTFLATLSSDKHVLSIGLPAMNADPTSIKNLVCELSIYYANSLLGEEVNEEPLQYADIAEWQHELLEAEETKIGREYWRKQDISAFLNLTLPVEKDILGKAEFQPEVISITIDSGLTKKIEELVNENNTSVSIFLLACWQILLWRLTGQDIIVGIGTDGRKYAELKSALGLFAKYLPLSFHLEDNYRFNEVLKQLGESLEEIYKWEDCFTWEEIVGSDASAVGVPFCPFSFEFEEGYANHSIADISFAITKQFACIEPFKIKLSCVRTKDAIIAEFHYNAHLLSAEDIKRLAGQFETLLQSAIAHPSHYAIAQLNLLSDRELQQLLFEFNNTETDYPKHKCIHQLFEAQVQRTPNNIALVFENHQLTYSELNQRANQVAHYLQELGVKPEVMVGICVERSLEMFIGILGILKAGGAYIPLDPSYPQERLAFMLEDAQTPVLLTQPSLLSGHLSKVIGDRPTTKVVCLDADSEAIAQQSQSNPLTDITPSHLAYVIYTSGSTGKPKGVQITHQNIVNSTNARLTYYQEPVSSFLLLSSFAFDSSVAGIFWTLCQGGTLHIPAEGIQREPQSIVELITQHRISHLLSLPSLYSLMLAQAKTEQLVSLRAVIVAGEACSKELVEHHLKRIPETSLFNEYGPTEVTVWSSVYHCRSQLSKTQVPIGRPIANTQIYILDSYLQPVPIGVAGELYISGVGVARGYLNRPDLTAEKFIPNPFIKAEGRGQKAEGKNTSNRLYKTGDLARYLPDGNIEFLGRIDHQVKIRGFRIEIGEIEALLLQHPQVREAVVIAREDEPGNKRLVAYAVPSQESAPTISNLSGFLKEKLPEYMVPSAYVMLKALPLTPNGKVDRRSLPAPERVRPDLEAVFVAPRTPVEKMLADIWAEVLGIEKVGVYDNFFELGGHSLLMTQLLAKVRNTFQVSLSLGSMFEAPTVAGMSDRIKMTVGTEKISRQDADLNAEAVLDPTIRPNKLPVKFISAPKNILLTGVTGFVGSFLLYELLQQTEADIYCLVRSANTIEGKQRIESTLKSYLLWDESQSYRIIPIVGDLSKPLFGLSQEQFLMMANQLDVIYHNGALVNFTYPYSALKAANVLGTQEILRLASQAKLKPVHFISTTSVFSSASADKVRVVREEDEIDNSEVINGGYAQSKWVAEKLVTIARSRDIPVAIYRLGRISGHSRTGACNTNDHTFRTIKGCIQLGYAPNLDAIANITPVDYASKAIVHLSKQKQSLGQNFHLVNPQPAHWHELVNWIRAMGYPLEEISDESWQAKLLNIADNSPENALYPLVSTFSETVSVDDSKAVLEFDCQNTINGLAETSIACPPVDAQLLSTYFSYLIRSGFLDSPSSQKLEYSFPKS
ncbi:amino acid adenylation domain-containing protein [Aerosakkonema sp. BLCC-F183]|uniref:non-ribosomal peptide synthetase family protein n=1 Tax=Aerosakkonema sp. BLCC-F183 TaxID=3342834 RepID=UPI0035BB67F6